MAPTVATAAAPAAAPAPRSLGRRSATRARVRRAPCPVRPEGLGDGRRRAPARRRLRPPPGLLAARPGRPPRPGPGGRRKSAGCPTPRVAVHPARAQLLAEPADRLGIL